MLLKLSESNEVSHLAKQYSSKLKNMNLHLREILAKKARLELEIKTLKKSIKEKQENYEKSLRVKLSLESSEYISDEDFAKLQKEDPYLAAHIHQLAETCLDIQKTLQEYGED